MIALFFNLDCSHSRWSTVIKVMNSFPEILK